MILCTREVGDSSSAWAGPSGICLTAAMSVPGKWEAGIPHLIVWKQIPPHTFDQDILPKIAWWEELLSLAGAVGGGFLLLLLFSMSFFSR